jgi:hypothetical protein
MLANRQKEIKVQKRQQQETKGSGNDMKENIFHTTLNLWIDPNFMTT